MNAIEQDNANRISRLWNNLYFYFWMIALREAVRHTNRLTTLQKEIYLSQVCSDTNKDTWRGFFRDGESPANAMNKDLDMGSEG